MDHTEAIAELSTQLNVVLRLAASAYDQTTLLKQALNVLAEATPMTSADAERFITMMQDVRGSEQEAAHVMRLMLLHRHASIDRRGK
jgi:hypothetical protein